MELQLFILGHVILFGICIFMGMMQWFGAEVLRDMRDIALKNSDYSFGGAGTIFDYLGLALVTFIPLEIIYWLLHWMIVGF
jgi:hypothetical protein